MKKSIFILLGLLFCFSFSSSVLAEQEETSVANSQQPSGNDGVPTIKEAEVVSQVGFNNAKIILQKDNLFRVYFQLLNPGSPETDIRYGFQLEKKVGEGKYVLTDEYFFEEMISVSPEQSIFRQVDYLAPDFLSGDYRLWIVAKQSAGQFRGITFLGDVSLSGTDQYLEIERESCFLKVSGEDQKYSLGEGVSFVAKEEILLDCMVKNKTGKNLEVKGEYVVFKRSTSAEIADSDLVAATWTNSFMTGERKAIAVKLPIPQRPQAYDVKFFLTSEGKTISNSVIAHYVLAGESATIETALFDKSQYQVGDPVFLTVSWLGSADEFLGSRVPKRESQELKLKVILKDKDDRACSKEVVRNNLDQNEQTEKIELLPQGDCPQMKAVVSLLGASDQELDRKEFSFLLESQRTDTADGLFDSKQKNKKVTALSLIIFLLFLPLMVWLVLRFRSKKKTNVAVLLALVGFSLFGFSDLVSADTVTLNIYLSGSSCSGDTGYQMLTSDPLTWKSTISSCEYESIYYCVDTNNHCSTTSGSAVSTISTNKNEYNPGETITVSAGGSFTTSCTNPITSTVKATLQGSQKTVASSTQSSRGTFSNNGSVTFQAPVTSGNYSIAVTMDYDHPPFYFLESGTLNFTVVDNVATCLASFNPAAIDLPGSSALNWSTSNADGLYFQCNGPLVVSYRAAASLNGSTNFTFDSLGGYETCTFTPFKGATAGTPCLANVDVRYCTGSVPVGSTMCLNDNTNLSNTMAWISVGSSQANCRPWRKCEYYTPGVPLYCTGTPPDSISTFMCPGDDTNLTVAEAWGNVGVTSASCTDGKKCEYYTPAYSCAGTAPDGITQIMCTDDNIDVPSGASWHEVTTGCTATKCEYYTSAAPHSCTETGPNGTSTFMCPDDNLNLTETLSWQNVTSSLSCTSGRKCEYFQNTCIPYCVKPDPCDTVPCGSAVPNICYGTCDPSDCNADAAYCAGTTNCGSCSDGNWEETEPF